MDHEPTDPDASTAPRQSDRPPVGVPLVASRRNPDARPAYDEIPSDRQSRRSDGGTVSEPRPPGELEGRVALVTGATREVGSAIAAELVGRGARVLLVDEDLSHLVRVVEDLDVWDRAVPLRCDLASTDEVASVCRFVTEAADVDLVLHVADSGDGTEPLDRLLGSRILGPARLIDGLTEVLSSAATVVVVDSEEHGPCGSSTAEDLLVEHLTDRIGLEPGRASCGAGVLASRFAAVLVDLLCAPEVDVDRLVLRSGDGAVVDPVGNDASNR